MLRLAGEMRGWNRQKVPKGTKGDELENEIRDHGLYLAGEWEFPGLRAVVTQCPGTSVSFVTSQETRSVSCRAFPGLRVPRFCRLRDLGSEELQLRVHHRSRFDGPPAAATGAARLHGALPVGDDPLQFPEAVAQAGDLIL